MILRALYEMAKREGLVSDADFQHAGVSWAVRVSAEGRILGIDDLRQEALARSGKPSRKVAKSIRVPRLPPSRSGTKAPPNFFVDNAKYVFGRATADKAFSDREGGEKSGWFRDVIADCASATADAGVQAILRALDALRDGVQQVTLPDDCRSNDLFAFIFAPDIDRFAHERPAVEAYWRAQRAVVGSSVGQSTARCVVTGEPVGQPGLFPKVRKVPAAQSAGAQLVSFNAAAFESWGLRGNENAPVSRAAAEGVGTALQRLVDPAFPDARAESSGAPLPRRHVHLGGDTLACFWSNVPAADDFLNDFCSLLDPADPGQVKAMYQSIWRGRPAPAPEAASFYVLLVAGAQGRLVVRDWIETPLPRAMENLARYFDDLRVVRNTPPPKDRPLPDQVPLHVLLASLTPFGKRDEVPTPLAVALVRAAIDGTPYPLSVLQRALQRARAEASLDEWADLDRRDARAALIKAVLRRTLKREVTPDMDPTNQSAGYLCGRLMAVLELLQATALGDVNASVVDRYFGAASANPRVVFVRLLKNAQHHARKALDEPKTAGRVVWLKRQIDEIASRFDARQGGFPAALSLEEQGMFVLGYHQQRHALWAKRPDAASSAEAATDTAAA